MPGEKDGVLPRELETERRQRERDISNTTLVVESFRREMTEMKNDMRVVRARQHKDRKEFLSLRGQVRLTNRLLVSIIGVIVGAMFAIRPELAGAVGHFFSGLGGH